MFFRFPIQERVALEAEIIRRCLSRTEYQCSFLEYRGLKIIYRRYASLFFVVAVDGDEEVRKERRKEEKMSRKEGSQGNQRKKERKEGGQGNQGR